MKLVCHSIAFGYTKKQMVFEGYGHEFQQGISVLKGYSGCGKTTLLKILAGYLKIDSGKVETPNGVSVLSHEYRSRHVSYMFQGVNLLPLATVDRNLRICAEMVMMPKERWKVRSMQLLEELGLEKLRFQKAGNLSGGQAQRAALARTLMKDSDVLLLDEPTSGLDDANTNIIKRIICQESKNKICIVSTHDSRLFEIADEIIDFDKPVSC